jgi:hypothetical protein
MPSPPPRRRWQNSSARARSPTPPTFRLASARARKQMFVLRRMGGGFSGDRPWRVRRQGPEQGRSPARGPAVTRTGSVAEGADVAQVRLRQSRRGCWGWRPLSSDQNASGKMSFPVADTAREPPTPMTLPMRPPWGAARRRDRPRRRLNGRICPPSARGAWRRSSSGPSCLPSHWGVQFISIEKL